MKYSLIIGIVCIAIAAFSFYLEQPETLTRDLFLGAIGGLGIGFLLGGFMGYLTKKTKKVVEIKEKVIEVEKQQPTSTTDTTNHTSDTTDNIA